MWDVSGLVVRTFVRYLKKNNLGEFNESNDFEMIYVEICR